MLCLPVLLLTASIGWAVNSHWLYNYGFNKYDVSETTGLAESELETVATGLIDYFNSGEENVSITMVKNSEQFELFTPEEIIHFRDVKGLIWLDYWVLLGTLIYALGYTVVSFSWRRRRYWRRLAWGAVGGGGITLALMLALGLGTLLGFDQLFNRFHLLFFDNPYWAAKGFMLLLFPEPFFYDAALFCAGITTGLAVVLGGAGGGYLLFTRRRTTY